MEPKMGDWCIFWDYGDDPLARGWPCSVRRLGNIDEQGRYYGEDCVLPWKQCRKAKPSDFGWEVKE
jgi:hypothetical protein